MKGGTCNNLKKFCEVINHNILIGCYIIRANIIKKANFISKTGKIEIKKVELEEKNHSLNTRYYLICDYMSGNLLIL